MGQRKHIRVLASRTAHRAGTTTMTREEARELLDAARDGTREVSYQQIRAALVAGGDLSDADDESDPVVIHRPPGTWERNASKVLAPATWCEVIG